MQKLFQPVKAKFFVTPLKANLQIKFFNWLMIFITSITLFLCNSELAYAQANTYIIRSGDTLAVIAYRHSTSVRALKEANGLSSDLIYPGQRLVLPGRPIPPQQAPSPTPTPSIPKPEPSVPSYSRCSSDRYTVQRGDTLYSIAVRSNSSIARIKRCNNLYTNTIWAGQILRGVYVPQTKSPAGSCGLLNARCQRKIDATPLPVSTAMENGSQTTGNSRPLN